MGLWDKVKGAVRTITGGGATVTIEVGEITLGEPFVIRVNALAKASINVSGVYVQFKATEHAEVRDVDYDYDDGTRRIEYVEGQYESFAQKFVIGEEISLSEGQEFSWEAEITLPETANPTFDGHMISHRWCVLAGLDCFGNDPDSGWQVIEVWDN